METPERPNDNPASTEQRLPSSEQMTSLCLEVIDLYHLADSGSFDGLIATKDEGKVSISRPPYKDKGHWWSPYTVEIQSLVGGPTFILTQLQMTENGHDETITVYTLRETAEETAVMLFTQNFSRWPALAHDFEPHTESFSMAHYETLVGLVADITRQHREASALQPKQQTRNRFIGWLIGKVSSRHS